MPKPIICLASALSQYAEEFRACFTRRQYQYFVTILLGLIECQERRTLSAMLRTTSPGVSLSGLSRFMGRYKWSTHALAQIWLASFRFRVTPLVKAEHTRLSLETKRDGKSRRGRPAATVVTGFLSLDDSVHYKPRGKKMGGLGRHYSNCEKRVVTGHGLFGAVYEVLEQRCPLLPQLYVQRSVCEQTGRVFKSKLTMAIDTVAEFEPVPHTRTHVLVDSWYHSNQLRKATRKKGYELSGALKANRRLRVATTQANGTSTREWQSLQEYASTLSPTDWQLAEWPSQEGNHPVYVHTIRTQISKLGATRLVLTKPKLDEAGSSIRYWGSTLLEAEAQTILECLAKRWAVEVFFEDAKDLLGSDHYQVMSCEAIERFWALIALTGNFLDQQRAKLVAASEGASYSWGQSRAKLQAEQGINLLKWLQTQFLAGQTVEQLSEYLALAA